MVIYLYLRAHIQKRFLTSCNIYIFSVKQFPDIACIHLSPKHENGTGRDFVTIGMWSQSVIKILQLPDLNPVLEHTLDSVTGPKDVLVITLEKIPYLMVLLGK